MMVTKKDILPNAILWIYTGHVVIVGNATKETVTPKKTHRQTMTSATVQIRTTPDPPSNNTSLTRCRLHAFNHEVYKACPVKHATGYASRAYVTRADVQTVHSVVQSVALNALHVVLEKHYVNALNATVPWTLRVAYASLTVNCYAVAIAMNRVHIAVLEAMKIAS
jgi:hypothetical protein